MNVHSPISNDERLVVLKQELTILATKISGTVDTLWKIRGLSLTLWTAAFTVGIGNFSTDKRPILALLLLTAFLPLLFLFVDAKNNQWYRRLSGREFQIQRFLNDQAYVLPATGKPATMDPSAEGISLFPTYDLTGVATFDEDPKFHWQTSTLRSMVDPIPTTVYWSQVFFSCATCKPICQRTIAMDFFATKHRSVSNFEACCSITTKADRLTSEGPTNRSTGAAVAFFAS